MPNLVSIVIPCFDKGKFIDEAVDSVLQQSYGEIEVVIVDDGSRDAYTQEVLRGYRNPKIKVIHTDNQGVSRARNKGIEESRGEYILPLDADDKIEKDYVRRAVEVLDSDLTVGLVYCLARFFDGRNGDWSLPPYSREGMLIDNMIFCSAFFRRADWQRVNGYNSNMQNGYEDWDFWLSLIRLGLKVHRIPQSLFCYRMGDGTARHLMTEDRNVDLDLRKQLFTNHLELYRSPPLSGVRGRLQFLIRRGYVFGIESERPKLVRSMRMANAAFSGIRNTSPRKLFQVTIFCGHGWLCFLRA